MFDPLQEHQKFKQFKDSLLSRAGKITELIGQLESALDESKKGEGSADGKRVAKSNPQFPTCLNFLKGPPPTTCQPVPSLCSCWRPSLWGKCRLWRLPRQPWSRSLKPARLCRLRLPIWPSPDLMTTAKHSPLTFFRNVIGHHRLQLQWRQVKCECNIVLLTLPKAFEEDWHRHSWNYCEAPCLQCPVTWPTNLPSRYPQVQQSDHRRGCSQDCWWNPTCFLWLYCDGLS